MKKKLLGFTAILLVMFFVISSNPLPEVNAIASGKWMSDATGWWYDLDGSYARGWREIDGYWYYFLDSGYMDYSEYRDGCWLNADGTWNTAYSGGYWASDSKGWWYTDASGWYPVSTWLWIDGNCYYFKASGYMAVNETIDGYYVDASGKMTSNSDTSSNGTHTHTWVCTKDAWDEKVPKYEYKEKVHYYCADCNTELANMEEFCPTCGSGVVYNEVSYDEVLVGYDTVGLVAEHSSY